MLQNLKKVIVTIVTYKSYLEKDVIIWAIVKMNLPVNLMLLKYPSYT